MSNQHRKNIAVEARIISEAEGIVEYVASDSTLDSYHESILPSGWRFDFFQRNAPFVDSHNYYSIEAMLGKVVGARIEGDQLIERVQWAKDIPEHKLATIGWKLTVGGFLKAVSVGFRSVKAIWPGDAGWNAAVAQAKLSAEDAAKCRRIFAEQQQLELSACVIGANPAAVAKAWTEGCVKDADLAAIGFSDDDMTFLKTAGEALERTDSDPLLTMMVKREMVRITHRKFSPTEPKSHSSDTPRGDDLAAREAAQRAEMIRQLEAPDPWLKLQNESNLTITERHIIMKNRFQPLFEEFNGGSNGGGLSQDEFQKRTLEGIGAVKKQFTELETKFADLDKESKKLGEDLAKQTKAFDGLPSQVMEVTRTLGQIQLKLAAERRSNHGSALERISADPECRNAVNGVIRTVANLKGMNVPITDDQKKGAEAYFRALSDAASPGSTYINAQLLPDIYSTIAEYGIWRNFDVIPVSTSSAKLIVDSTDPTMYWTAENTAATEGAITGSNVTATINKLIGWIQVSRELLEDAEIDVAAHLLRKFANAAAYGLEWACLQADGGADSTDGGFTGIFGGSGTAAVAASGNVSVATLDFEDWLAAMLAVDAAVLSRPTARWFIHPQMLVRALAIKDGNGRPIFLPSVDAPAPGAIGSILGAPVILCHGANATDGVSKKIAVYGDAMGQAVCLRRDFEFAASDQVKFTEDSVVFRARVRGAAKTKKATAFGVLTTAAS